MPGCWIQSEYALVADPLNDVAYACEYFVVAHEGQGMMTGRQTRRQTKRMPCVVFSPETSLRMKGVAGPALMSEALGRHRRC